jgi:hypothetical protein
MRRRKQRKEIQDDDSEADLTICNKNYLSKIGLNFEFRRRNSGGPYDLCMISNDLNESGRSGCALTHEKKRFRIQFKGKSPHSKLV